MNEPFLLDIPHTELAPFYHAYVDRINGNDWFAVMNGHTTYMTDLARRLSAKDWAYSYAPGKWSVATMLRHIVDCERIMGYRALCIARGERQALPGFDENEYAAATVSDDTTPENLVAEYRAVRDATIWFARNLPEHCLERKGLSNGREITVRALLAVIAGHEMHHRGVLRTRYDAVIKE